MKRALLLVALAACAGAQSFFSMRGLGEITPVNEARQDGLGGPAALTLANPGILVNLPRTSFSLSAFAGSALGTESGHSRLVANARPAALDAALPLPWATRLSLGLEGLFDQDFNVWSESTADTAYRRNVVGSGGIYALRAGFAKSFWNAVCVGAEYDHLLGGAREEWRFLTGGGALTSTDTLEWDYAGNTMRLGAAYQGRLFSLGASYQSAGAIAVRRYKRVHGVVSDSDRVFRLYLPRTLSAAAGVSPTSRLSFTAGLSLMPWASATITRGDTQTSPAFRNTWRASLGAEYGLDNGYELRAGLSHQDWYCTSLSGTTITENGLDLGTSVPVPKFGSIDISGGLELRSSSGLTEVAGHLMLTLSYREAWTKRIRHWGY